MDLTADYLIDANGLPNILSKNNKNGNSIRPNCALSNSCDKNSFRKFSNQNRLVLSEVLSVRDQLNNKTIDKKLKNCENEEKKHKTFYNEIIKKRFQNKDNFSHLR